MSKRDLKKYLGELTKDQVAEQLLELYDKFPDVKAYYNFVFNPKEDKLVQEAKMKISNEYFPIKTKRAKLRRSVAQKYIKHFILLGVEPHAIAEVMIHNVEVAVKYSAKRSIRYDSFYKSIQTSFSQAGEYVVNKGIFADYIARFEQASSEVNTQKWDNRSEFTRIVEGLHYLLDE